MNATERLFSLVREGPNPTLSMDELLVEIDRALDAGADLHGTGSWGQRLLQVASLKPSPRLIDRLIECGADPADLTRLNSQGSTALHAAAQQPSLYKTQLFLRAGADPNALNHLKQTVLGVALLRVRDCRWVRDSLIHEEEGRKREQSRIDECERVIALLEEHGALAHRPARPRLFTDAAHDLNTGDSIFAFHNQDFDSLEELALWMKECSDSPLEEIEAVLASNAEARTIEHDPEGTTVPWAFFHHGDLHVEGDLHVSSAFVVTGDMVVDGVLSDSGPDSYIAVGGSLRAKGITTNGDVRVGAEVEADVVHGSYNDQVLEAAVLRARVLLVDDHSFRAERDCEIEIDLQDHDPLVLGRVFARGLYEQSGDLNVQAVFDWIRAGKDVFADEGEDSAAGEEHLVPLPLEQFEKWLKSYAGNQRSKLASIKQHWTPSLVAADSARVREILLGSIKSPKLQADLAAYLDELAALGGA